jgi:uncharacterized membrane protein YjjP (DUF1212 family)
MNGDWFIYLRVIIMGIVGIIIGVVGLQTSSIPLIVFGFLIAFIIFSVSVYIVFDNLVKRHNKDRGK